MGKKEKKEKIEKDIEVEEEREVWDPKKIFISLGLIGLLIFFFSTNIIPSIQYNTSRVLGIAQKAAIKEENKAQFEQTKEELQHLVEKARVVLSTVDVDDVSSKAAELDKILNDIKSLQNKSKDPKDIFCERVCK